MRTYSVQDGSDRRTGISGWLRPPTSTPSPCHLNEDHYDGAVPPDGKAMSYVGEPLQATKQLVAMDGETKRGTTHLHVPFLTA